MCSIHMPNLIVETNVDQVKFFLYNVNNYELKWTCVYLKTQYFSKISIVQY